MKKAVETTSAAAIAAAVPDPQTLPKTPPEQPVSIPKPKGSGLARFCYRSRAPIYVLAAASGTCCSWRPASRFTRCT